MRQYLLSWAKENGFDAARDDAGNIIVYRDATPGFEDKPTVALQGHMDMVCVKTAESNHDFTKDPIEVYEDGDWLKAKDTSLGGDNGIAVAMTMALFTDPQARHGKLEGVFTFSEETGMNGAYGLDGSLIKARKLINVDSEEEGIIYVGCAGGIDLKGDSAVLRENTPENYEPVVIRLSGLKGGHSGDKIHCQRTNAISALARMLCSSADTGYKIRLASFNGGTKKNVIPFAAECLICIPTAHKQEIMEKILSEFEAIKTENILEEPDFAEEHHCSKCDPSLAKPLTVLTEEETYRVLDCLFTCPHGVHTYSHAFPGLVETSDNLAIVRLEENSLHIEVSVRSLAESAKADHIRRITTVLSRYGLDVSSSDDYPAWTPDLNSSLAKQCARTWKDITGKEPQVKSIHAGLECSVINTKIPGVDCVSIGPEMYDIHSVNEKLSISSSKRMYTFIKTLLENIEN